MIFPKVERSHGVRMDHIAVGFQCEKARHVRRRIVGHRWSDVSFRIKVPDINCPTQSHPRPERLTARCHWKCESVVDSLSSVWVEGLSPPHIHTIFSFLAATPRRETREINEKRRRRVNSEFRIPHDVLILIERIKRDFFRPIYSWMHRVWNWNVASSPSFPSFLAILSRDI